MTSDSDLARRDTDYAQQRQDALDELSQMQLSPQRVTNPEDLEALERQIRERTDRLAASWWGTMFNRAWIQRSCKRSKTSW